MAFKKSFLVYLAAQAFAFSLTAAQGGPPTPSGGIIFGLVRTQGAITPSDLTIHLRKRNDLNQEEQDYPLLPTVTYHNRATSYDFKKLPQGEYRVIATGAGVEVFVSSSVFVRNSSQATVDITLESNRWIFLRVVQNLSILLTIFIAVLGITKDFWLRWFFRYPFLELAIPNPVDKTPDHFRPHFYKKTINASLFKTKTARSRDVSASVRGYCRQQKRKASPAIVPRPKMVTLFSIVSGYGTRENSKRRM